MYPEHFRCPGAERQASGAGNKWSDEGAELVPRRLHAMVRPGLSTDTHLAAGRAPPGAATVAGIHGPD